MGMTQQPPSPPAPPPYDPESLNDRATTILSLANLRTFLHDLAERNPTIRDHATMANLMLTLALDRLRQEVAAEEFARASIIVRRHR